MADSPHKLPYQNNWGFLCIEHSLSMALILLLKQFHYTNMRFFGHASSNSIYLTIELTMIMMEVYDSTYIYRLFRCTGQFVCSELSLCILSIHQLKLLRSSRQLLNRAHFLDIQ